MTRSFRHERTKNSIVVIFKQLVTYVYLYLKEVHMYIFKQYSFNARATYNYFTNGYVSIQS